MKIQHPLKITECLRKISRSLQLDTDRSFHLEMNSEGNLRITGITDIKGYDEYCILVVSPKYITDIKGYGLFMEKFSEREIIVSGKIDTVSFIKR